MKTRSTDILTSIAITAAVLLACVSAVPACDPSDPAASSGVPRTAKVGTLSAADAARLCDWTNQRQGGYGQHVTCTGSEDMSTDPDQKTCTDAEPDIAAYCPDLTVGDVEDCTNAVGTDLCKYTTAAACATLRACLGT